MIRRVRLLAVAVVLLSLARAADFNAASATNQVGLDLYRQLAANRPVTNLVISPYSIESALALVYAGADGATRTEISAALGFPADDTTLQSSFGALRSALADATQHSIAPVGARPSEGGPADAIEWHAANRLFGQSGYAFRDSFVTLLKDGYAAPFVPLNFKGDAKTSLATINGWVSDQTQGKIRNLIPAGGVDGRTRLVLVNALYLKAPWSEPFKKSATRSQPFHLADGSSPRVSTMQRTDFLGYAREDGLTVVTLEYLGGELQCLIVLPDTGVSLATATANLTPQHFARWARLGRDTRPASVALYLPKFRLEGASLPLGGALRSLGIKSAFDDPPGSANFDRIALRQPDEYLALSEVYHRSFVLLDEEGTEAAAATGGIALTTLGVSTKRPIEVRVDRPFLFAIQHRASGVCLFLGRITDPR